MPPQSGFTHQIIHFIPANAESRTLSLPIKNIMTSPARQDAGTNHWCFYLCVDNSACSPAGAEGQMARPNLVQLDCLPSYIYPSTVLRGGSKANVVVSELMVLPVPGVDVEMMFTLDLDSEHRGSLTVGQVLGLLIEHGRHKYEFDERGVGCRFWVTDQLNLFRENRILGDRERVDEVKGGIRMLWPEKTPLELDQGAYYE